ncbi:MAG: DUF3368 domain-containing protein [Thermoanaerobaculia bacterium]|nr:DUF3368 domain-containing protein [Thermoanaerobaculia bacterium]
MLAQETRATKLVLDDLDARRRARRLGLPVVGTVGLLLAAKLRGELPSVAIEVDRLQKLGFHASESLVAAVLDAAGEKPRAEPPSAKS